MTVQNITQLQTKFNALQSNKLFELFVISVIILSALLIGAKTYDLPPLLLTVLGWLDVAVTMFFVIEIFIRFVGTDNKRRFFHSGWNVFDTLIVTVSLIPVEDSEMAILGRLIRIFRVLRMVSVIPELRLLVNSLLAALPQLGYLMLLMFIIFYIFAAVGSYLFEGINPVLWGDISISMLTLFRVMTFEDWTDVMYETMAVHPWSWAYYLVFIFLTTFAFLNMVIGVVVGAMDEENNKEKTADKSRTSLENLHEQLDRIEQTLAAQDRRR
jgi:voltage-gated sodium channel